MKKEERKSTRKDSLEHENIWWCSFFKVLGFKIYDAEYADSLRKDGIAPEVAVGIIKNS